MCATLRHSSCIIIKSIFFSVVVTTAFSSFIIENTITVSKDAASPQMQPLLLIYYPLRSDERFLLALPEMNGDAVTVTADEGSELWLMCSPEKPDDFEDMQEKIKGTAVVRNELPAAGWQLSHTKCLNKVTASTHNTGTRCGDQNSGTIYEVGFLVYVGTEDEGSSSQNTDVTKRKSKVHGRRFSIPKFPGRDFKKKEMKPKPTEFISLYESCYDNRKKIVLFSKTTIHGSNFNAKARLDSIPVLPDDEWFYDNRGLIDLYKKDVQFGTFFNIFHKDNEVTNYNDRVMRFLVQLQLTSADNMMFYSWRATAFTQFNVTGVWESIMGIGWRKVEETVDQYISQAPQDIQIVAGTSEILRLGQKNHEIYLQPNSHLPNTGVGNLIWKLLYNTDTHDAVVLIAFNNPHATTCEKIMWCEDQCLNDNSPLASFKDPWTGCIICCSYQDAKNIIKDMPKFEHVARVIRFPN